MSDRTNFRDEFKAMGCSMNSINVEDLMAKQLLTEYGAINVERLAQYHGRFTDEPIRDTFETLKEAYSCTRCVIFLQLQVWTFRERCDWNITSRQSEIINHFLPLPRKSRRIA